MKEDAQDITLRDVIAHIHAVQENIVAMEKRLSSRIDRVEKGMESLSSKTDGLSSTMKGMETRLTERIDALEEDLTATMKDSLQIRQFVGMPVPAEE